MNLRLCSELNGCRYVPWQVNLRGELYYSRYSACHCKWDGGGEGFEGSEKCFPGQAHQAASAALKGHCIGRTKCARQGEGRRPESISPGDSSQSLPRNLRKGVVTEFDCLRNNLVTS